MNKDKDAYEAQDEWEIKLKQKTKHLKNKKLQSIKYTWHAKDMEIRYWTRHGKGSKGVCKRWLCAMHEQDMRNAHVG